MVVKITIQRPISNDSGLSNNIGGQYDFRRRFLRCWLAIEGPAITARPTTSVHHAAIGHSFATVVLSNFRILAARRAFTNALPLQNVTDFRIGVAVFIVETMGRPTGAGINGSPYTRVQVSGPRRLFFGLSATMEPKQQSRTKNMHPWILQDKAPPFLNMPEYHFSLRVNPQFKAWGNWSPEFMVRDDHYHFPIRQRLPY
jgi:hypothetical protein